MSDFEETLELIEITGNNDPFELTDAVLPAIAGKATLVTPDEAKENGMTPFEIPGCKHPLWKSATLEGWLLRAEPKSSTLTRAALACCSNNQALPTKIWIARLAEFGIKAKCLGSISALAERIQAECH